jgi:thioredoxin-related protein
MLRACCEAEVLYTPNLICYFTGRVNAGPYSNLHFMGLRINLIFIFVCCLVVLRAEAQSVGIAPLLTEAQKQNRKIFIYIHASWCGSCREMEKYVFPTKTVKDLLNDYLFVSASLDSGELGRIIAKKYAIATAPVLLLLSPTAELLHYHAGGGPDTAQFLEMLDNFKKERPIQGFSTDFSLHYPPFYESFFPSYHKTADSSMVCAYLDSQADLRSEINFDIFSTMPLCRKYYSYFLANFRPFSASYGPLYCYRVERLYLSNIQRIIQEKDTVGYAMLENALYHVDSLEGYNRDYLRGFRYLQFLGRSGLDWDAYARCLDRRVKQYGDKDLENLCKDVNEHCTDSVQRRKLSTYCPLPAGP